MQKPSCIVRNRFSWVTPAILSRSVRNFTQWQGFRWDASLETVDNLSSWATFYNADFREMWIPYTWINNVINPFGNEMAIFTLKGSFTPKPTLSQVSVDVLSARTFLPELPSAADSQYLLDFCQPDSDVASRRRLRSAGRRLLNVPPEAEYICPAGFSVTGPLVWNSLPDYLRDPEVNRDTLCRHLKMFLFAVYWYTFSALEVLRRCAI